MTAFSNEQLAAFVMQTLPEAETSTIRVAAAQNLELASKLVVMQTLSGVPVSHDLLPERWRDTGTGDPTGGDGVDSVIASQATTEFDASSIRESIEEVLQEVQAESRPLYEWHNREIIAKCFQRLFGDRDVSHEMQRFFFEEAARSLSEAVATYARQTLVEQSTTDPSPASRQDTARGSLDETTFAQAESHPERILRRMTRLEELNELSPDHAAVYRLVVLAGRTLPEAAELMGRDVQDVTDAIAVATTEVHLDDEGTADDADT